MIEKRKDERYVVDFRAGQKSELVFLYELLQDGTSMQSPNDRDGVATMLNVSKTGCYVYCDKSFPPRARLHITILPVMLPNEKIFITGNVIRQKADRRTGYYYGIEFSEFGKGTKSVLNKFIDKLIIREQSSPYFSN